jgi:hypothetical protein
MVKFVIGAGRARQILLESVSTGNTNQGVDQHYFCEEWFHARLRDAAATNPYKWLKIYISE